MAEVEFKWLHLSDLHLGLSEQDSLWPTLKHSFLADLAALHKAVGNWDVVIFSGDLSQRGTRHEFDKLEHVLTELWQLFGSLHEPSTSTIATAGSLPRTSMQAPSMFGLTHVGEKSAERIHGYSLCHYRLANGREQLRAWPRRLYTIASGERRLGPDTRFALEDNNSFLAFDRYQRANAIGPALDALPDNASAGAPLPISSSSRDVLRKARHVLPPARAHFKVRRVEQQNCLETLTDTRAVWLVAEWGMGAEG